MSYLLRAAIVVLATALPVFAAAQAPAAKQAPYIELTPPQPTDSAGRIEVIGFFWYGCPHCYALEPLLEAWSKKLPKEVAFKRVPAIFNEQWAVAARVFYALEAIGEQERVHQALFDAVHKDNLRITDESAVASWLAKQKVDINKYKAAYRSFGVEARIKRAMQMSQSYKLDGVPALAVQGRYVLTAAMINDRQDLLNAASTVINRLIAQQKGAAAKPAAKAAAPKSAAPTKK